MVEATDTKGEQLIHHYQYTYDLQSNITNIEKHGTEEGKGDLSAVTNTAMTYTADNRLETFNGQKVTYDADGNIIDDNSTKVRFLYNGQAGVETDENGLYYMRARYYNTVIKRFINRDIIDGNIQKLVKKAIRKLSVYLLRM